LALISALEDADSRKVSRPGRLALYLGTAIAVVGMSKLHAVAYGYSWSGSARFAWSLVYVWFLCVTAYACGLPDQRRNFRGAALASVAAAATASLAVSVVQLFVGDAVLPRFVVLGAALVLVPWYALCAVIARDSRARATERDRVVIVAEHDEVEGLDEELADAPERPAIVVGLLTPAAAETVSNPPTRPLFELAQRVRATVVVLSRGAQNSADIVTQASELHERGMRIRTLALFDEQWLGKQPIGELERMSLLFDIGEIHGVTYARVKRLFDLAFALVGMVALAITTPVVIVGDLFANRGPLLYRQPRVGRNGTTFSILKFRTMRECAPDEANDWTMVQDTRITPFGNVMRRTHLDELPQMVNILRGELSFVGPRPEQPQVVAELTGKIPYYGLRHLVRPGLTGWAQVKYQYAGSEAETLEKLQYEFFYLRRQSLSLDIRIVFRTARIVFGRKGR
jgi:lipopolysaccharide/colanic/teichoic acid biosynthesis glycosyltransferase